MISPGLAILAILKSCRSPNVYVKEFPKNCRVPGNPVIYIFQKIHCLVVIPKFGKNWKSFFLCLLSKNYSSILLRHRFLLVSFKLDVAVSQFHSRLLRWCRDNKFSLCVEMQVYCGKRRPLRLVSMSLKWQKII